MSVAARSTTGDRFGVKARIPPLAPPFAALLYPFALEAFSASVTRTGKGGRGFSALAWLSADEKRLDDGIVDALVSAASKRRAYY